MALNEGMGGGVNDTLRIGIVARAKQGDLLAAIVERGWSQSDLARFLGVTPQRMSHLMNMRQLPADIRRWCDDDQAVKLLNLTGKLPDELWPPVVRGKTPRPMVSFTEVPLAALASAPHAGFLPPHQENDVYAREASEIVRKACRQLSPRTEAMLRARVCDELEYKEIAGRHGLSTARVQQIVAAALRRLRQTNPLRHRGMRELRALPDPAALRQNTPCL